MCQVSNFNVSGATYSVTDPSSDVFSAINSTQFSWTDGSNTLYAQFFEFYLTSTIASVTFNSSTNIANPTILCSTYAGVSSFTLDAINQTGTVSGGLLTVTQNPTQSNDGVFCGIGGRSGFSYGIGPGFALSSLIGGPVIQNFLNQVANNGAAGPVSWTSPTTSTTGGMGCVMFEASANAAISVPVTGGGSGSVFYGIGVADGGTCARLLQDYPSAQQSQIYDYLFKPDYGAAAQILKVEIGSDANSTEGSCVSYDRTGSESVIGRGNVVNEIIAAKARNSAIKVYGLAWGAPGWVGSGTVTSGCTGTYFTNLNINYLVAWVQAIETATGYPVDYLGGWNETSTCANWTIALRTALNTAGLTSTNLVTDDNVSGIADWGVGSTINSNPTLKSDIFAIGQHYMYSAGGSELGNYPTALTIAQGKPLWDTEEGAWQFGSVATWSAAAYIAHQVNVNYVQGGITSTSIWAAITGYYGSFPLPNAGLMTVNTPWSGNYAVSPALWTVAHTTQFIQPGWQYLNAASSYIYSATQGSYVTATNGTDYSVVIETVYANVPQTFTFTVTGGLNTGTVQVWESTSAGQLIQQSSITPSGGVFSFTAQPGAIYSLTTTTGQAKGSASPPSAASFPFPYADSYQNYTAGKAPLYISPVLGSFEIGSCISGRSGNCLIQTTPQAPIPWPSAGTGQVPLSIVGDSTWANYSVNSDVALPVSGTVSVYGRITSQPQKAVATGYSFNVTDVGAWTLTTAAATLASGTLGGGFGTNTWHTLKLSMNGTTIAASVDGTQVASVTDSTYSAGQAGLGTATFIGTQFDNLQICAVSGCTASAGTIASSAVSGVMISHER
jgi:hypothetical protein